MSSKIQFTIMFGEGTLENGPMGVVANGFNKSTKYVENPGSKSFGDIFNWLARGLRVDLSTHHLMVQTFVNWSNEAVIWELMTIENTEQWQSYVQNGLQRGWPLVILARCFPNNQANVEAVQDVACIMMKMCTMKLQMLKTTPKIRILKQKVLLTKEK